MQEYEITITMKIKAGNDEQAFQNFIEWLPIALHDYRACVLSSGDKIEIPLKTQYSTSAENIKEKFGVSFEIVKTAS